MLLGVNYYKHFYHLASRCNCGWIFMMELKLDNLVKSHEKDDTVKSSRCKAHESLGTRRT